MWDYKKKSYNGNLKSQGEKKTLILNPCSAVQVEASSELGFAESGFCKERFIELWFLGFVGSLRGCGGVPVTHALLRARAL